VVPAGKTLKLSSLQMVNGDNISLPGKLCYMNDASGSGAVTIVEMSVPPESAVHIPVMVDIPAGKYLGGWSSGRTSQVTVIIGGFEV